MGNKRLRIAILPKGFRFSEIRWVGKKIQWVISGVQTAFWTQMDGIPKVWFTFSLFKTWKN